MTRTEIPTVTLPGGEKVVALGQGTWGMAEDPARRADEIATLRHGLDLGMTVIDTAEMYADGDAQTLVGEAIAGRRDEVFLVDKVLPGDASRRGTVEAAERALRRLGTDRIDLYLLHWRGRHPLADTVEAFRELQDQGKIRHWGVSNLDVDDLDELVELGASDGLVTDQVLYNPTRRGPEWDLLPWLRGRGLPIMAYSPIEQGRLLGHPALAAVAAEHDATVAQIALAWVLDAGDVLAIPKASSLDHVEENRDAVGLRLTDAQRAELDRAFPPPQRKQALEIL
ncbi:diketogulonate reductase-like aldo/keto reductase [Pseudonocardia sediminis]|uniref:Diketogulonate reductase-like aldo/keto reductase n=1 Tax=Pseudonocardia sediminis TaxID=1397368 RepID=A0A4Q7UTS6_PSEST|nr:aldo/keto reductase [Pseudonocardia sediminis]RZT85327.1 diketogulonate reductase-like aldo/keto reductase [Pseudonocardia sediminis]